MEEKHLGKEIIALSHQIKRKMQVENEAYGITGTQSRILYYIARESKECQVFQRDVEREFNIRRSTATEILKLLEKKGLIRKKSVEGDKRLKQLIPTENIKEVEDAMYSRIQHMEEELASKLTKEEHIQLMYLLEKLQDKRKE